MNSHEIMGAGWSEICMAGGRLVTKVKADDSVMAVTSQASRLETQPRFLS